MNCFPSVLESIDDLGQDQIDHLLFSAQSLKRADLAGNLAPLFPRQKRSPGAAKRPVIATFFLENSTRTQYSFAIASAKLGGIYLDFNPNTSSLDKGESLIETLLTLHYQGVDLCIIRSPETHLLAPFKKNPPLKIINGGDGMGEHPTQALLDLFTMEEQGLGPGHKTVAIFGDILHSRTAHSLIKLLLKRGAKIILCGPPEFLPATAVSEKNISLTHSLDEALAASDMGYLFRIQFERHGEQDKDKQRANYIKQFRLSLAQIKRLKKDYPLFHPGPANIGVEIELDLIKSSHYMGYQQVINSVYMRMAIIFAMLEKPQKQSGQKS